MKNSIEFEAFQLKLSSPARNALANEGIDSFEKLAALTQKELLSMHGIGPKSLPVVNKYLDMVGLRLRK